MKNIESEYSQRKNAFIDAIKQRLVELNPQLNIDENVVVLYYSGKEENLSLLHKKLISSETIQKVGSNGAIIIVYVPKANIFKSVGNEIIHATEHTMFRFLAKFTVSRDFDHTHAVVLVNDLKYHSPWGTFAPNDFGRDARVISELDDRC